jgi:acetyl esterase
MSTLASLDRHAERLLRMLEGAPGETQVEMPPLVRREALVGLARFAESMAAAAEIEERDVPGPDGWIKLRIYSPPEAEHAALPAIVFFHGGGWVAGGLETHDGLCRRLCAAAGARAILVDYRLAPEHRFPAALDDCLAATDWVARLSPSFGVDPARLVVAGDSVGGGLAAAVARMARDGAGPKIALQLLICPILDISRRRGSRKSFGDGFFVSRSAFARDLADYLPADVAFDDPRISPLRARDFAGLPPALIHTAEFDPFRDEGEAYAKALAEAGVGARTHRHAGMIHYFYALARAIPYAERAAEMIGADVREALSEPALARRESRFAL